MKRIIRHPEGVNRLVFQKLVLELMDNYLWDYRESSKKRKYLVSCSSQGENHLLMSKVRGKWPDCFILKG